MSGLEMSSFEEVGERLVDAARLQGMAVPSADALRIGPFPQPEHSVAESGAHVMEEPDVGPLQHDFDQSTAVQSRRVLVGVVNTAAEYHEEPAGGHAGGEHEPRDEPLAPVTDAGSGGDKPPVDRGPRDGATDDPEEPNEGGDIAGDAKDAVTPDEAASVSPRPVEIHHTGNYDLVVNREHPEPQLAAYAAKELRNGIPSSWPLKAQTYRSDQYVDSTEDPRLFVKTPRSVNADGFDSKYVTDVDRAAHSVLSQISVAKKVEKIVSRDEAVQEVVRDMGFASLSVPQPVAGLSDRQTGQKAIVYPAQDGVSVGDARAGLAVPLVERVAEEVDRALRQGGVVPNDHSVRQYMFVATPDGPGLALLDTEAFYELPEDEVAYIPGNPVLQPGETQGVTGHIEYQDDDLDVETATPSAVVKVGPDSILAGRRAETDAEQSPVLHGQLHDGRMVAIWNERTGEGGLLHFSPAAMKIEDRHYQHIDGLLRDVPTLGESNVRAWVVGDETSGFNHEAVRFSNAELRTTLWELGIDDPKIMSVAGVKSVELHTSTGDLWPYDEHGNPLSFDVV